MISEPDFERLFLQHKDMVYNLTLHYVQHTGEAEDISQEVFIKIHSHWDQFNAETASVKTWITRITINQCLDFIKYKKTKKRFAVIISIFNPSVRESVQPVSQFGHPGFILEQKEELERLFILINNLPENQKTVIILNKIEDRPIKEVAVIMNISEKAVESLLSRAKQNLSKKINIPKDFK
jgi:RNA polymerase sigma-70 factor, ECF subfamily